MKNVENGIEGKYMYENIIIIPALNPPKSLIEYVEMLIDKGFEHILLIDDGSDDESKDIFQILADKKEVVVLKHAVNLGKGRALKNAFNYVLSMWKDDKIRGVITVDSDGQHTVEDVINIQNELAAQKFPKLILGTRDFDSESVPPKSRYGNKITSKVFQLLYGTKISDTQTGLRGIPKEYLMHYLDLSGERFEFETNMLIYAVNHGQNITEYPIQTVYVNQNAETHFKPVVDSLKIYYIIFKAFFCYTISSLSSAVIDLMMFQIFFMISGALGTAYQLGFSTVMARIISSIYNFAVNRVGVFKSSGKAGSQAVRYYVLCVLQMMASAVGLILLDSVFKGNELAEKVVIDTILFFISYRIQHAWVFRER